MSSPPTISKNNILLSQYNHLSSRHKKKHKSETTKHTQTPIRIMTEIISTHNQPEQSTAGMSGRCSLWKRWEARKQSCRLSLFTDFVDSYAEHHMKLHPKRQQYPVAVPVCANEREDDTQDATFLASSAEIKRRSGRRMSFKKAWKNMNKLAPKSARTKSQKVTLENLEIEGKELGARLTQRKDL
jgi:hypothetical protein